ncbi:MAG: hydroxymethylglutaryl-CoA reductase, degradative [Proteobacteria bacterium]|nr:hydroxymethylglutaryl-CoA reductase, degradative [Cystobacterineae bacterium]MCL2258779.1 hydroxymethylglutaryl-CoA reductase, degradative [Cystobacterineae bacterium]MCL2314693.1 hydroxymethylglutaryl-CoA reductase, degradative [Pseudomonadota bacterium]
MDGKSELNSRLSGFHKHSIPQRLAQIHTLLGLDETALCALRPEESLSLETAGQMIENAIGVFSLPLGMATNFKVNQRDYLIPMAIEEPSVLAAVSFAAKTIREAGGFEAETDGSWMIGQIQLTQFGAPDKAGKTLLANKEAILELANSVHPNMLKRGGGAKDMEIRLLPAPEGPKGEPLLIIHLTIDAQEAMGANLVNTMAEAVAPLIEELTGGKVFLRILSNLADRRLARAKCRIPVSSLATAESTGEGVAQGVVQASRFAMADPYRAATHNKGIMNGIDAMAIAAGQDFRAIEAGAHAFACRDGQYRPLSTWVLEGNELIGRIELPLALGTVGGPIKIHPGVQAVFKILRIQSVHELAMVMASVGLAQNFSALRALGSTGIQRGHMAMHARSVAATAGATADEVADIAKALIASKEIKVEKAKALLVALRAQNDKGPLP